MIKSLLRAFSYFSVGTVITLMILLVYFAIAGQANYETGVKVVALLNGIDISGNRLQKVIRDAEDREQPDFEEILEARRREGMNMDLRLRSQREARDDLSEKVAYLVEETGVLDNRLKAFNDEVERVQAGAEKEGNTERQMTIQALEPDQAKDQLLRMFNDDKVDDVVSIIKAMPGDKRSEVLQEFETEQDKEALYEILNRLGEGLPMTQQFGQPGA